MSQTTKSVILNGKRISCNMTALSVILSGKWKPLIIWQLMEKTLRFGELKKNLEGISPRILSRELRELEHCKIIKRTEHPSVPPKVEYQLTEVGKQIQPAMDSLCQWSNDYIEALGE